VTDGSLAVVLGLVGAGLVLVGLRNEHLLLTVLGAGALSTVVVSLLMRPPLHALTYCFRGPVRVRAGQYVQHELHVHNRGRRSTPRLLLTHHVDGFDDVVLAVPALPPGASATVSAWRLARTRGVRELHSLRAGSASPFGLMRFTSVSHASSTLVVHPRALPAEPLDGRGQDGDLPSGVTARSGAEPHAVREYRPGDPVRRVHWRSSARHGRLVVVEPERTVARRVALLVAGVPVRPGTTWRSPDWEDLLAEAAWGVTQALPGGGSALLYAAQPQLELLHAVDEVTALDWFAALGDVRLPGPAELQAVFADLSPGDRLAVAATCDVPAGWWDLVHRLAAEAGCSVGVHGPGAASWAGATPWAGAAP